MKKTILMFAFAITTLSMTSCKSETKTETTNEASTETSSIEKEVAYVCPMDCEKGKTYAESGKCPVCEMDLIASTDAAAENHDNHDHDDHEGHNH